jgi:hypothetical protein
MGLSRQDGMIVATHQWRHGGSATGRIQSPDFTV